MEHTQSMYRTKGTLTSRLKRVILHKDHSHVKFNRQPVSNFPLRAAGVEPGQVRSVHLLLSRARSGEGAGKGQVEDL